MGSHDTHLVGHSEDDDNELQAELERTRILLREVLEALLDDGWTFHRDSPIREWWQEQVTKPQTQA